jgi:hypothetical protein
MRTDRGIFSRVDPRTTAGFLDPRKGSGLIKPRFLWSTGVTDPGYSDAHSHANFSNL